MTSWLYSRSCRTASIRSGRAGGLAGELDPKRRGINTKTNTEVSFRAFKTLYSDGVTLFFALRNFLSPFVKKSAIQGNWRADMSHTKHAPKRKRGRRAVPLLGVAGMSLALAGGASARNQWVGGRYTF